MVGRLLLSVCEGGRRGGQHTRLSMADIRTPLPLESLRWDRAHKSGLREGQSVPSLWPR